MDRQLNMWFRNYNTIYRTLYWTLFELIEHKVFNKFSIMSVYRSWLKGEIEWGKAVSKLETFGVPQGYSIAWNELEKIIDVVSAYQKKYIS